MTMHCHCVGIIRFVVSDALDFFLGVESKPVGPRGSVTRTRTSENHSKTWSALAYISGLPNAIRTSLCSHHSSATMAKLSAVVLASLTVAAFGCRHPEFIGAPLEWGGYPQPCSDAGGGLDDELRLLVGGYHNKFREYLVHGYIPGQGEGHQTCRNVYTLVSFPIHLNR